MNLWWQFKRWLQPEVGRVNLDPEGLIRPHRLQEIEELLSSLGFSKPDRMLKLRSTKNEVFHLQYLQRTFVLKIAGKGYESALDYEGEILHLLQRQMLPGPKVVGQGTSPGHPYTWFLLSDEGFGMHFYQQIIPRLLYEAGKLLARYHLMKYEDFSKEKESSMPEILTHSLLPMNTWQSKLTSLIEQDILTPASAKKIFAILNELQHYEEKVLCHGEFTLPHILVRKKKVNCAIDWPSASWSNPASDLAISEVYFRSIRYPFRHFLQGYRTVLPIDDYLEFRPAYSILAIIKRLRTPERTDQNPRFLKVLNEILDEKTNLK